MNDYPISILENKLIISLQRSGFRLFAVFNSHYEFFNYQQKFLPEQRNFYEIILGEYRQKPHFDLDISNSTISDSDAVVNRVIDAIDSVLTTLKIKWNPDYDLLIYTSHGSGEIAKRSYHIVINNYCHANNVEAKIFYQMVNNLLPEADRQYLDHMVYSPRQQYRLLGSSKENSGRIKTLCSTWKWNEKIITHQTYETSESSNHLQLINFEESLVSAVSSCSWIPMTVPTVDSIEYKNCVLTKEIVKAALDLLRSHVKTGTYPYKYLGIRDSFILLKRISPSNCRQCKRVHHAENPYLLVIELESGIYKILFNCRRSSQNWEVGTINVKVAPPVPELQPGRNLIEISKLQNLQFVPLK